MDRGRGGGVALESFRKNPAQDSLSLDREQKKFSGGSYDKPLKSKRKCLWALQCICI